MEHIFEDLKTDRFWAWGALTLCVVLIVFLFDLPALTSPGRGFVAIGAWLSLCVFLWPSLMKAAHEDHRHVLTVCIWSAVAMLIGIAAIVYGYYAITGTEYAKYDKLLNIVPVFVAIWAAALGWFVHFKLTSKAHRTNNAFSIIMETRKSSEFLRKQEVVTRNFPPGSGEMPPEYHPFLAGSSLKTLNADPTASQADKDKAEAVLALKYVLNYYEFMAVGIRAGDLDEALLYDTIHPSVCALFDRAQPLVVYMSTPSNPGGDATAYCDLKLLVGRWKKKRLGQDAAA